MNIKIHYSFVIYIFILFFLNLLSYFTVFFVSIIIHELSHAIAGYLYGLKIEHVFIDMCGVSIKFCNLDVNYKKRIIIYLIGPVSNLIMVLFTIYMFKNKFSLFIITNLFLFIFNLLPIYPLDGGKVLEEIINKYFYNKKHILIKFYTTFHIILLLLLSYFCINFSNLQLFFLGVYFLKFTTQNKYKNIQFF